MPKALLVSSKGGHLDELLQIKLSGYDVVYAIEKNNSSFKSDYDLVSGTRDNMLSYPFILFINTIKAFKILKKEKPDVVISTGAHSCVPFFYLARCRKVYIESFAVINNKSLTYKLIHKKTDHVLVQHKQALNNYKDAKYFGGVY